MYNHFEYNNGSNPYITTNNERLFYMVNKYALEQHAPHMFTVTAQRKPGTTYAEKKAALQEFAMHWQEKFSDMAYSYSDLAEWGAFFEEYGRKYGLLREFRENGIL